MTAARGENAGGRSAGLLRVLGLGFGLAVIIGNTVGSGILRTPGPVAAQLPHLWLFLGVWVAGGLYALLGAFSMSELGAMMPRSGGYYVFARRALGEWAGFVVGWTDWLAQCGTTATASILVGEYAGQLSPALAGRQVPVAAATAIGLALAQARGIRWGSVVQNLSSALKALVFVLLLLAFVVLAPGTPTAAPPPPRLATGLPLLVALIVALQSVIYTYDGWYGIIYFGEEVKNPARDVPRSMIGGVLLVMALYVMINAALVALLPLSVLAGDTLAVGAAARLTLGPRADAIMHVVALICVVSGINAFHLMASRIPLALSRDGLLPPAFARVNRGGTPTVGLFFSTVAALLFILTGSFEEVSAVMAFFFVANYAMAFTAVFVLRRREPGAPRPFRAWGYPATTAVSLALSVAFLVGAIASDTRNSLRALGVLAASYPLYLLAKRLRSPMS